MNRNVKIRSIILFMFASLFKNIMRRFLKTISGYCNNHHNYSSLGSARIQEIIGSKNSEQR
jgi:hypothetical protein